MSERFEKVFSLSENLYAQSSPVILSQGFLLKDHQNNTLLAQLKLKSVSDAVVKAVKVRLTPLDADGNALADSMTYAYANLAVERDQFFGQKSAAVVSAAEAVGFDATVVEVTFADDTTWSSGDAAWEPLPQQKDLLALLQGDTELVKQYQIEYSPMAKYQPVIDRDLWLCTCGAVNRRSEALCHVCDCSLDALGAVNFRALNEKKLARLQGDLPAQNVEEIPDGFDEESDGLPPEDIDDEPKSKKQKKKEKKEKKEKKQKPKKKKGGRMIAVLLVLVILAVGGYFGYDYYAKESTYQNAVAMLNTGEYSGAISAFEKLGDYKDSADQIQNSKYLQAVSFVEQSRYEEAIAAFEALGNFKDCPNQIQRAKYLQASFLSNNGHYADAVKLYRELGSYEDAAAQLSTLYKLGVNYIKEERYDLAVEIFSALGDYQKAPGLLLCTLVGQKMSNSFSSVTQEDLDSLPKDYPYGKKLLAHYEKFKALQGYCGTFICTEQTSTNNSTVNKKDHVLISDFQLVGGRILWVFSDTENRSDKNSSEDFKPVSNYYFFTANRAVIKNRVADTYAPAGVTNGTATITFEDGKITYRMHLTNTSETPINETLVYTAAQTQNDDAAEPTTTTP